MDEGSHHPDPPTTGLLVCMIGLAVTLPVWAVLLLDLLAAEHRGLGALDTLAIAVGWTYLPATVWGFIQGSRRWPSPADRYYALLGPPAIVVGGFVAVVLLAGLVGR